MRLAQAPGVPDPASLKDLPTPVAILLLCVIALLALLAYFGGAIRDRLTGTSKEQSQSPPSLTPPGAPVATPAHDRAAQVSDQYTGYLLKQIEELKERVDRLERENRTLREDVERYRAQASFYPRGRDA